MEATVTPAGIWIVIVSPSMERMRSQHHATLAIQSVEAAQSIPIASRVAGLGQPWSMVIIKEQAQGAQRESHDIVRLWQRRELGLMGLPLTARFPVGKPVVPAALTWS